MTPCDTACPCVQDLSQMQAALAQANQEVCRAWSMCRPTQSFFLQDLVVWRHLHTPICIPPRFYPWLSLQIACDHTSISQVAYGRQCAEAAEASKVSRGYLHPAKCMRVCAVCSSQPYILPMCCLHISKTSCACVLMSLVCAHVACVALVTHTCR